MLCFLSDSSIFSDFFFGLQMESSNTVLEEERIENINAAALVEAKVQELRSRRGSVRQTLGRSLILQMVDLVSHARLLNKNTIIFRWNNFFFREKIDISPDTEETITVFLLELLRIKFTSEYGGQSTVKKIEPTDEEMIKKDPTLRDAIIITI